MQESLSQPAPTLACTITRAGVHLSPSTHPAQFPSGPKAPVTALSWLAVSYNNITKTTDVVVSGASTYNKAPGNFTMWVRLPNSSLKLDKVSRTG